MKYIAEGKIKLQKHDNDEAKAKEKYYLYKDMLLDFESFVDKIDRDKLLES